MAVGMRSGVYQKGVVCGSPKTVRQAREEQKGAATVGVGVGGLGGFEFVVKIEGCKAIKRIKARGDKEGAQTGAMQHGCRQGGRRMARHRLVKEETGEPGGTRTR